MSEKDHPTDPIGSEPPDSLAPARHFAELVGVMLEPLNDKLHQIANDTKQLKDVHSGITTKLKAISDAMADLNRRVTAVEKKVAGE